MIHVHVIGMSHIDLGFTMTEEELSELLEIFTERMLGILDRCPDICYSIEQMRHYKKLKERRPDLFERLKRHIQNGRIEIMGAMASSMETNFPNGECFIRNQMLGLQWAQENFEASPKSAWLVDTFGLNAQIPQIYRQFGFQELFANRFGGDKCHEIFYAQGIDGSRLLVIGRDLASPNVRNGQLAFRLCRSWGDTDLLFEQADCLNGEGPRLVTNYIENEEVLSLRYAALTREREKRGGEHWKLSSYRGFLEELYEEQREYPVMNADLNPEFTGTFALRAPLKVRNRCTETLLLEAEKWNSLTWSGPGNFDEAWWEMAFIQFHDVFTGSHGDQTYRSVMEKFNRIDEISRCALEKSVQTFTEENPAAFTLLNGLPWERREWVPVPPEFSGRQIFQDGREAPAVCRGKEWFCQVCLPPAGAVSCSIGDAVSALKHSEENSCQISNEFFRLKADPVSGALSLYLANGTAVMENVLDYLTVQEDVGGFQIESPNGGELFAAAGTVRVSPVYRDQIGEKMTVSGEFPPMKWNNGKNRLKWTLELEAISGQNGLHMRILLDWLGEGTRIRLNLPTCVRASGAVYEIPFGIAERTSYRPRNTAKGEWPAHRFTLLEDGEKGLALINRGMAGVEICGQTLSATLLRAYLPGPMAWVPPTPETSRHGKSSYEFLLLPYAGSWKEADVVRHAQAFNSSPLCWSGRKLPAGATSYIQIDCSNIVLSAVKNAADHSNDLIVRLYETYGRMTDAVITIRDAASVVRSDVNESCGEPMLCEDGKIPLSLRPFEILTLRIQRAAISSGCSLF